MSNMQEDQQPPKLMDLDPLERHVLIGELVDAMIYSSEAVFQLQYMRDKFRALGYIRSKILPQLNDEIE